MDKPCVLPMKVVQHCTESILFLLTSSWTWLLGFAAFTRHPCGVFLQDTTACWHICLITRAQWWCRQSRGEKASEGGLFSSARTGRAFTRSKAHERGSRPPALPASLTPATFPLVSQQAVDFNAVVCFVLRCVECAYFPGMQTLWNMPHSVAYAGRLFIGNVDCDARFTHAVAKAFFQNMSKIKWAASPWLGAVCVLLRLVIQRCNFLSSYCHYCCWTNCHRSRVFILNISQCETKSEPDVCLSQSMVLFSHISCN